jgi:hypothetical protein
MAHHYIVFVMDISKSPKRNKTMEGGVVEGDFKHNLGATIEITLDGLGQSQLQPLSP